MHNAQQQILKILFIYLSPSGCHALPKCPQTAFVNQSNQSTSPRCPPPTHLPSFPAYLFPFKILCAVSHAGIKQVSKAVLLFPVLFSTLYSNELAMLLLP